MEPSVGFCFRILRVINCKMVISVRVFQRSILAGLAECLPRPHQCPAGRGFLCWPGKGAALGHPWGQPGARGPVGFLHRPVYGELGLEAARTSAPASPLLTSCLPPCLVPGAIQGPGWQEAHVRDCPSPAPEPRGQEPGLGLHNRGPTCLASRTLPPTSTASMQ